MKLLSSILNFHLYDHNIAEKVSKDVNVRQAVHRDSRCPALAANDNMHTKQLKGAD